MKNLTAAAVAMKNYSVVLVLNVEGEVGATPVMATRHLDCSDAWKAFVDVQFIAPGHELRLYNSDVIVDRRSHGED